MQQGIVKINFDTYNEVIYFLVTPDLLVIELN